MPRITASRSAGGPSPRFTTLVDRLFVPVVLVSRAGRIGYLNRVAGSLFRMPGDWYLGRRVEELAHPDDRAAVRRAHRDLLAGLPSGSTGMVRARAHPALDWRVLEYTAENLLDDPEVGAIVVAVRDATARLAETQALEELAYRDPVTGLANRTRLVDELQRLLETDDPVTVGLVSIDRLSLAEDSLGLVGAEAMLRTVARRVRAATPASGLVARLEGGTFGVILSGKAAQQSATVGWRIVERVRTPLFVDHRELLPSVSVGIASREPSATASSLLWDAGFALHRAEERGGGRVETFWNGHRQEVIARVQLEADLRRAVADAELSLAFQPIVRVSDRSVVSSEALLRWHHPQGDLRPGDFVPVAEAVGLIIPIGEWVVDQAARLAPIVPGGRVSANLSARQLALPNLPRILDEIVRRHGDRSAVQFEITETLLIEEWEYTASILAEIRRLGYRVGLDDFGTGYSSLAYLRRLPIDFLKIDRSLIADIDSDRQARAIVGAVVRMAEALDLEVVAEGVERETQAKVLGEIGAMQAQGYHFGLPEEIADPRRDRVDGDRGG